MLIMIDLSFVLPIWVLTDAKKSWAGPRCILNVSYATGTILTASYKGFFFTVELLISVGHLHSDYTKFCPGEMFI